MSSYKKNSQIYKHRLENNICVRCGINPTLDGLSTCDLCRAKQRVYSQKYAHKQKMLINNVKQIQSHEEIEKIEIKQHIEQQELKKSNDFEEFKNKYKELKEKHIKLFQTDVLSLLDNFIID